MSDLRKAVESLPDRIDVLSMGGVVQGAHITKAGIKKGERLTGPTFISRCSIPDIQPNVKIVAVCGINDWQSPYHVEGQASPKNSGWFFSDFYLFHHLLRDVSGDQVWLTCVSPERAVQRYGEYLHGDPYAQSPRRIVLDKEMLEDVRNVRTVPPNILLERFLATLKDACAEARAQDRPILVLVFGHGEHNTFHIGIGGNGSPENAPTLSIDNFKRAVGTRNNKNNMCLLTTACYGGGWAINPDLNITTMSASMHDDESLSWPVSGTANMRLCGSPYATAIADTLLRMNIDGYGMERDDIKQMPTYAGFLHLIRDRVQEVGKRNFETPAGPYTVYQPLFSAENDDWTSAYSTRTGLPLSLFQERWLQLRVARPGGPPPESSPPDGPAPGSGIRLIPGGKWYSQSELLELVKREGNTYRRSKPGIERPKDTDLHSALRMILDRGECPSAGQLAYVLRQLDYRMVQIMATATIYKNYLGIDMPDCHQLDMDMYSERGNTNWSGALSLVSSYPLFDRPEAFEFSKGRRYIAACIDKAGWDRNEAIAKLESLLKFRNKNFDGSGYPGLPGTSRTVYTIERLELSRDRKIRETVQTFANSIKKKMRELSPSKDHRRRRSTIPGQWKELDAPSGSASLASPKK